MSRVNFQYVEDQYPASLCQLNGEVIENVEKFIYLGSCIKYDQPNTGKEEVELRIDCAENTLYRYAKKFFNRKIAIKTRVQIMNSMVRSRLVYGCQGWSLTKQLLQKVSTLSSCSPKKYLHLPSTWSAKSSKTLFAIS